MKKILKEYFTGCLTVPNLLSFLRIVMVPIFAVLFHQGRYGWAVFVLALSGLSDFFDGKIARRFNQISNLGKMLDPVADKLTKDYLISGGSKDTVACRAGIGRQMLILKNARSVTAREITEREWGADHCCCGNQLAAMDAVLLWAELMERRDKSLKN